MSLTFDSSASLPDLPLPIRALFAGYILIIGVGLLMAGAQILLTHGMAGGGTRL